MTIPSAQVIEMVLDEMKQTGSAPELAVKEAARCFTELALCRDEDIEFAAGYYFGLRVAQTMARLGVKL